jgi:hypothetical protein
VSSRCATRTGADQTRARRVTSTAEGTA